MSTNTYNYKIVLLGESAVGKSSITLRFVKGKFLDFQDPTIGAAFLTKTIYIKGDNIRFEIWDTAGQERYRSLAPMYYKNAKAAIIVFDINALDSFIRAKKWVNELKRGNDMIIALVGNKCDLDHIVSQEEAQIYANENELLFLETSAKHNINIDQIFISIAEKLPKDNLFKETIIFDDQIKSIKKNSCC